MVEGSRVKLGLITDSTPARSASCSLAIITAGWWRRAADRSRGTAAVL
jgi:hypothetical protein